MSQLAIERASELTGEDLYRSAGRGRVVCTSVVVLLTSLFADGQVRIRYRDLRDSRRLGLRDSPVFSARVIPDIQNRYTSRRLCTRHYGDLLGVYA